MVLQIEQPVPGLYRESSKLGKSPPGRLALSPGLVTLFALGAPNRLGGHLSGESGERANHGPGSVALKLLRSLPTPPLTVAEEDGAQEAEAPADELREVPVDWL